MFCTAIQILHYTKKCATEKDCTILKYCLFPYSMTVIHTVKHYTYPITNYMYRYMYFVGDQNHDWPNQVIIINNLSFIIFLELLNPSKPLLGYSTMVVAKVLHCYILPTKNIIVIYFQLRSHIYIFSIYSGP